MLEDIGGGGKPNRLDGRGRQSQGFQVGDRGNISVNSYVVLCADNEYRMRKILSLTVLPLEGVNIEVIIMSELGNMSSDSYVVLGVHHEYCIGNMLSLCILPLEGLKVVFFKLDILAIFTSKYMFSRMLILNIEVKI